jgi:hypothetical protein
VGLLALVAGCRRETPVPAAPETGERGTSPGSEHVEGARVVDVTLTGTDFQMNGAVLPGPVRFHVRNATSGEHSFAVEGNGRRTQLGDPIEGGGTADLEATLTPGSYRIFCPLRGHASVELAGQLVVTSRAGSR